MEHSWSQRLGVWWIAEDHPDLPAVVASPSGTTLTFGELAARAHQIVHALRSRGVGAGDIVAYALPNDVDIIWWPLAFQEMGVRSIALNPALTGAEVARIIEASGARALVVDAGFPEIASLAATPLANRSPLDLAVSVAGDIEGFTRYEDLVDGRAHDAAAGPDLRHADLVLVGHDRSSRRASFAPRSPATPPTSRTS